MEPADSLNQEAMAERLYQDGMQSAKGLAFGLLFGAAEVIGILIIAVVVWWK